MISIKENFSILVKFLRAWPVLKFVSFWDNSGLLILMRYWFIGYQTILRKSHCIHTRYEHRIISECISLCTRLIDDRYAAELFDEHTDKWGELTFTDDGKLKRLMELSPEQEQQEKLEYGIICKMECQLKKQDQRRLGLLIGKHLSSWWD